MKTGSRHVSTAIASKQPFLHPRVCVPNIFWQKSISSSISHLEFNFYACIFALPSTTTSHCAINEFLNASVRLSGRRGSRAFVYSLAPRICRLFWSYISFETLFKNTAVPLSGRTQHPPSHAHVTPDECLPGTLLLPIDSHARNTGSVPVRASRNEKVGAAFSVTPTLFRLLALALFFLRRKQFIISD